MKSNPWLSLDMSTSPFVHPEDKNAIERQNAKTKERYFYDLRLRPEPYIGDLNAKVLLLALNPGLSKEDFDVHLDPVYLRHHQNNLLQVESEYPFYYIHPSLDCPGATWWRAKLKWLITECGLEQVSRDICCLQYVPYHSIGYKHTNKLLHSQMFNQSVLKNHIAKGLPVIVLRSRRYWEELVPELVDYDNVIVLKNPRNPTLSPRNMGEGHFSKITKILLQHT